MPQATHTTYHAAGQMAQRVAAALEVRLQQAEEDRERDGEKHPLTLFDSASIPPVSMSKYLARLAKFCHCGEECFIAALVYVDIITQGKALTPLSMRNAHRLFLTCLLIAHKFWDDNLPLNSYYAKCGGISLQEMNRLEKFFLNAVGFRLKISTHTYAAYETAVNAIERLGQRKGTKEVAPLAQKAAAQEVPEKPSQVAELLVRPPVPPQPAQKRQCLPRTQKLDEQEEEASAVELSVVSTPIQQRPDQKCLHRHQRMCKWVVVVGGVVSQSALPSNEQTCAQGSDLARPSRTKARRARQRAVSHQKCMKW